MQTYNYLIGVEVFTSKGRIIIQRIWRSNKELILPDVKLFLMGVFDNEIKMAKLKTAMKLGTDYEVKKEIVNGVWHNFYFVQREDTVAGDFLKEEDKNAEVRIYFEETKGIII
jgi:hypothetical protein